MTNGLKYVLEQMLLLFIIAALACLFLAIGLMIGYSFMGDGKVHGIFYLWISGQS